MKKYKITIEFESDSDPMLLDMVAMDLVDTLKDHEGYEHCGTPNIDDVEYEMDEIKDFKIGKYDREEVIALLPKEIQDRFKSVKQVK